MGTVMVEVATIDMDDPITDRSLVATLVGTSHPALTIGDPSSAEVVINALIPLSIEATDSDTAEFDGRWRWHTNQCGCESDRRQ